MKIIISRLKNRIDTSCLTTGRLKAFSLIELAVIISIAAAATVGFLAWTQPSGITDSRKVIETHAKLEKIADAIKKFRVENGRLPCPADPYMRSDNTRSSAGGTDHYPNDFGEEDLDNLQTQINGQTTLGVDCHDTQGAVPVIALGLGRDYINDGWKRRFTYKVSDNICGADAGTEVISDVLSAREGCSTIDYNDSIGDMSVTTSGGSQTLTDMAAYAVISHGANGHGAFLPSGTKIANSSNSDEAENSDGDNIFVKDNQTSVFDDIVYFRTKIQIERLTDARNIEQISVADCEENSQAIAQITTAQTDAMSTHITTYEIDSDSNLGEDVVMGLLNSIQSICVQYYGATAAVIDGETWSGAQCPGNNNPGTNGTTYYEPLGICTCEDGAWDGGCTMDWDAVMPVKDEILWLDASDAETLYISTTCLVSNHPANNQVVGCWKDKSGMDNNAISSGSFRPRHRQGQLNGRATLEFDGVDDYYDLPKVIISGTSARTFFVVARSDVVSPSDNRTIMSLNSSNENGERYDISVQLSIGIGGGNVIFSETLNHATDYSILSIANAENSDVANSFVSKNGELLQPSLLSARAIDSGVHSSTRIGYGYIASAYPSLNFYYDGHIAEIIAYDRLLSSGEIVQMEEYLSAKWGI